MIHPDTELRFIGPHIGHGVVATKLIPKGTITWVRDPLDAAYTADQITRLGPLYKRTMDTYTFIDAKGEHVLCWDAARYVNHSCDAPCLTAGGFDFEFAIRDIHPGEQLCDDYGTLNTLDAMPCACGAKECRGSVGPDDPSNLADEWDRKILEAFPEIAKVAQPLMTLVAEREALEAALKDPSKLPSCREHFGPTLGKPR